MIIFDSAYNYSVNELDDLIRIHLNIVMCFNFFFFNTQYRIHPLNYKEYT